MQILFADAESYSVRDVKETGSHAYCEHPSTHSILWSTRAQDWKRSLVFEATSLFDVLGVLKDAKRVAWNRNKPLLIVHWSPFDEILERYTNFDREVWPNVDRSVLVQGPHNTYWYDLSLASLTYGGPADLKGAAKFWAGEDLKDDPADLIKRFCKPNRDGVRTLPSEDPVRWAEFVNYASQDTEAMVPIWEAISGLSYGHPIDDHAPAANAVRRMNERGFGFDIANAKRALVPIQMRELELTEHIDSTYGLKPKSYKKIAEFLDLPNAQGPTLDEYLLRDDLPADRREVAEALRTLGGAARTKLARALQWRTDGGRVRGAFIYHGPHTRRMSAKGVQPQNFVRAKSDHAYFEALEAGHDFGDDIFEQTRLNIRGFITPAPGKMFVAADYAQIELRVGAWFAGEQWLIDALARGEDVYRITAGDFFELDPSAIGKGSVERQFGKTVELAALFGLGEHTLLTRCEQEGLKGFTLEDTLRAKVQYRRSHMMIEDCWGRCREAFLDLIDASAGAWRNVRRGWMVRGEHFIKLVRPSGFCDYYWQPGTSEGRWPDGNPKIDMRYVGKAAGGFMVRKYTHGADLFQSYVQGVAADLILDALPRVEAHGFDPVLQIHDELVCEVPVTGDPQARVEELCALLSDKPSWAEGLPVEAEGWHNTRFTK